MNKYLTDKYREETYELLIDIQSALLNLEETPDNPHIVDHIFGAIHTIKGASSMFGFDDVARFAHEVENIFGEIQDKKIPITRSLIDLILSACDQIRQMVDGEADDKTSREILKALQSIALNSSQYKAKEWKPGQGNTTCEQEEEQLPASSVSHPVSCIQHSDQTTCRIYFRPNPNIFTTGTSPIRLLRELQNFGECKIVGHINDIPQLKDIDPEICYLHWDVILTTSEEICAIHDVFIFVEDDSELSIDIIDTDDSVPNMPFSIEDDANYKRLGEILIERGHLSLYELKKALLRQKRLGELLAESNLIDEDALSAALAEQQHIREIRKKRIRSFSDTSIRVPSERLDRLVDIVSELMMFQVSLKQCVSNQSVSPWDFGMRDRSDAWKQGDDEDSQLNFIAEEIERLTEELHYNIMKIRMIPIETVFGEFRRMVRDLSNELGKETVFKTQGGDTELDKTVIDRIKDPLVHIIRNCMDHGIEHPDIREKLGKPLQGTICLSAEHAGKDIWIRISDDGAGIDMEKTRAKAIEKGLVSPDAKLSESEIANLIFMPRVSTAQKITDVSGRGMGMDVVKREIEAVQGSVSVSSQKGEGTVINLKLPLTMAIIEGLLARIGEENFVLPVSGVKECMNIFHEEAVKIRKRNMIRLRDETIPYLSLREVFHIKGKYPEIEWVVISEAGENKIGFGVDRILGQHQTVIKPLGKMYKNIKGISGATILGDGTVALIIDVNQLIEEVRSEK